MCGRDEVDGSFDIKSSRKIGCVLRYVPFIVRKEDAVSVPEEGKQLADCPTFWRSELM